MRSIPISYFLILASLPGLAHAAPTTAPATQPATTTAATTAATVPVAPPEGTVRVERGKIELIIDLDGIFEPVDAFEARAVVEAYQGDFVIRRAVDPNARVKKGDVLIEFDPAAYRRQVRQAEAEVASARANLQKAEADIKLGDAADALAARRHAEARDALLAALKWWDDNDAKTILARSELALKVSDFYVESAEDELEQLKKMYKSEDLTSETADLVVKRAVRMLEIQKNSRELLRSVTRRLKEFEVTLQRQQLAFEAASGEQAVAQLDAAQKQVRVQRETALVNARIALEQAEEKLAKLRRDESIIVLKSPIDGVAVYGMFQNSAWQEWQPRTLAAGEKLAARTICMTVVQPGRVRVRLDVPESRITWLQPGMKARVVPHAVGALTYEGTVSDVPLAGVNGGYDVLIDLPKVDERIAPGYRATVRIDCGTIENALLVPVEAVNRGRVWVRTADGKDEERFVRIGRSDGKQVEILSGVEAGEFVLKAAKK